MNYTQAIDYLFSLQKFGIKFGLSSTDRLLGRLGRPHERLKVLHLAGTNGKGSVGAAAASILTRAGYRVGFYTSPHLVSFRERFVIGEEMITEDAVVDLTERVKAVTAAEEPPTFFEFVTVMAFLYFVEQGVDLAVLETGMGGRLDATNVARPLASVITNISLEHTDYLGKTLSAIAREKAGIIKQGVGVITGEKRPRIREIFQNTADSLGASLYVLGRDFKVRAASGGGFDYYGLSRRYKNLAANLIGGHQRTNAALALAALELLAVQGFDFDEAAARKGLAGVRWPGRAETMTPWPNGPALLLDGAHNPAAARALSAVLKDLAPQRVHLVIGVMSDKDAAGIIRPFLTPEVDLYLTRPVYERAAAPQRLARAAADFNGWSRLFSRLPEAIDQARRRAAPEDLIVVTGSLFTVGEAKAYLDGAPEGRLAV